MPQGIGVPYYWPMPVVLITGATGFVGSAVARRFLAAGWDVVALTRDPVAARAALPASVAPATLEDVKGDRTARYDAVVHLAGASIAGGPWTRRRRDILWRSRVDGTNQLVAVLAALDAPPPVFVSASGMGYYGSRGGDVVQVGDAPGTDFLGRLAAAWEEAARGARAFGARTAHVRLGTVLGKGGGALPRMAWPFRLGAGAVFGPGTQFMPWIHVADAAELFFVAATDPGFSGPLHGVSAEPVTQAGFARALARVLRRPCWFRIPAFVLRLALGGMADLFLHGQRALPHPRFVPRHPELDAALRDALS